jgi:hypothetical protein
VSKEVLKAETFHRTSFEQASNKGFHFRTNDDLSREFDNVLGSFYLAEEFDMIPCPEWRPARHHLVQDRAYRPQVRLGVISLIAKDFGSHVQRGAAECVR